MPAIDPVGMPQSATAVAIAICMTVDFTPA